MPAITPAGVIGAASLREGRVVIVRLPVVMVMELDLVRDEELVLEVLDVLMLVLLPVCVEVSVRIEDGVVEVPIMELEVPPVLGLVEVGLREPEAQAAIADKIRILLKFIAISTSR